VQRIAVIGSPGAGKSTVARRLGNLTGIEVIHLDRLFWKPGWIETPRPEWIALQEALVQKTSWIIDGNYGATMNIRLEAADSVVFLDFPRRVCLWRAVRRAIQFRGQTRPDMGEDCPEKIDWEFIRFIWGFRKREQEKILLGLDTAARQGKNIVRLTTRRQVERYLASFTGRNGR